MITTALNEPCLFIWSTYTEHEAWEYEYRRRAIESDPIAEVLNQDLFNAMVNDRLIPRENIEALYERVEEGSHRLSLEAIGGRRAMDRRDNIYYDS